MEQRDHRGTVPLRVSINENIENCVIREFDEAQVIKVMDVTNVTIGKSFRAER